MLKDLSSIVGSKKIAYLLDQAKFLKNKKVLHINSTKSGGGVAEILSWAIPLLKEVGIQSKWITIEGTPEFFAITKKFHNMFQSKIENLSHNEIEIYEDTIRKNILRLENDILEADIVVIHDPQPCNLIRYFRESRRKKKQKWIWRCHIDLSNSNKTLLEYFQHTLSLYDILVFSMEEFIQEIKDVEIEVITPCINPFSKKNREIELQDIKEIFKDLNIDLKRPIITQISRFDPWKDPLGVIEAFEVLQRRRNVFGNPQLLMIGAYADDDPEGINIYKKVCKRVYGNKDIHIVCWPADYHYQINCIQRGSTIILQKSLKEGFGLTVTEAMWKRKAVIAGNVGGIKYQIENGINGLLVNSVLETVDAFCYLLEKAGRRYTLGMHAYDTVRDKFLFDVWLDQYIRLFKRT